MNLPNPTASLASGQRLRVSIFVDDPEAWIVPWAEHLGTILSRHHDFEICFSASSLRRGDICFLLGCTEILPREVLDYHKLNLVVHESALPLGRGWSPIQWQVLEGQDTIPVVLFQATEEADAGPIYLHDSIQLDGTELLEEIRHKQGTVTLELVCRFLELWPDIEPEAQQGAPTHYRRRTQDDDRLDTNRSLAEVFNHLRLVDNEKYPAWFEYRGQRYHLKVFKADEAAN